MLIIFNFVLISVNPLWFYYAWIMYSKWKYPSCFLKTFSKFSAFLCTYLYQKWKHLNACVFLLKPFCALLCHLWSKRYKIQHLYFLKDDDLCYVAKGSWWWQDLRCGIFSASLDVVFILSLVLYNFCIYCTMVMDNWHVTEIPQKLNCQEKILRWGH